MTHEAYAVASCLDMCPTAEIARRQKSRLIHRYETIESALRACNDKSLWKADPHKCVKQYSRAAAGQVIQKSCHLRPPPILMKTVSYLFESIIYGKFDVEPYHTVYDFVFDRLRAVRQDMVIQRACDPDCIRILECIVRFHIYSIYRLCEEPISVFDPHINSSHLQECLKRLLVWYDNGFSSDSRAEIEAYYLLFNLGSTDALRHALALPKHLVGVGILKYALRLSLDWINRNFYRVMCIAKQLPFLATVAVMPHVPAVRRLALLIMSYGFSAKNCRFPLAVVESMLAFDDSADARQTLSHYAIENDKEFVTFNKQTFNNDQILTPVKRYRFIREKCESLNVIDILYGINEINT